MSHHRKLEHMYRAAPCNAFYQPEITIEEGAATISVDVRPEMLHAGGTLHGSSYFKVADDAAFFAAQSVIEDEFILTTSFQIYFLRPVAGGTIRAEGRVLERSRRQVIAEAVVTDERGRAIARGSGIFMKSGNPLCEEMGY